MEEESEADPRVKILSLRRNSGGDTGKEVITGVTIYAWTQRRITASECHRERNIGLAGIKALCAWWS